MNSPYSTTRADMIALRQRVATGLIVSAVITAVAPSVRATFYALGRTY